MAVKPAISDVISNSPLALLERHAGVCADCVERLPLYFAEAQASRWGRANDIRDDICRLEGLADELKQDVRSNLPRGLWMSVSRADLLELVRVQDKMANGVKEVSGISLGRKLAFPHALTDDVNEFINSGWEFGGQTSAAAKLGDEGGAFAGAMSVSPGIWLYQLTDDGLALELTGKGTKYYKEDDLN